MITELSVQNFKGLKDVTLADMRSSVVIVGKNNSGKSSLLEAIFLLLDCTSPEVFFKLNRFRAKDQVNGTEDLWGRLFGQAGPHLNITAVIDGSTTVELSASHAQDGNAFYSGETKSGNGTQSGSWRSDTVFKYLLTHGCAQEQGSYTADIQGIRKSERVVSGQAGIIPVRFVPASRSELAVAVLLGEVELRNQKPQLLRALQIVDDTIEDIIAVTQPTGSEVYVRSAAGLLPLAYAGDGLRSTAALVMQTMLHDSGGIVLVDEIENGIHYTLYESLWKTLTQIALSQGAQIIATTHSYEFVTSAYEAMVKDHNTDKFSLYRVDQGGQPQIIPYSTDETEAALRFDMEIR